MHCIYEKLNASKLLDCFNQLFTSIYFTTKYDPLFVCRAYNKVLSAGIDHPHDNYYTIQSWLSFASELCHFSWYNILIKREIERYNI